MDLALFGRYFLDFALLYPSAFLCLAALWEKLRTPKRTACIAAGCITLLCIGCAALCTVFGLNSNAFLPVIVLVSFWLLRWRVAPEVTVSQTAFLFSISAVMMAVCSLLSMVLNARAESSNPQTACLASTALLRLGAATGSTAPPCSGAGGCCGSTAVKPSGSPHGRCPPSMPFFWCTVCRWTPPWCWSGG